MRAAPGSLDPSRPLRIAYLGPTPHDHGGVAGVAWLTLTALAHDGHAIDCYLVDSPTDVGPAPHPGVRYCVTDHRWRWRRWYSRQRLSAMMSWQIAVALGRRRAVSVIMDEHRARPYDVLYQFSTIETFGIAVHAEALPPLVLHPQVHAYGELRSMWQERRLSIRTHQTVIALLVAFCLAIRVVRQRRSIRQADHVIAISRVFAGDLIRDYRLSPGKVTVVPSPIAVERFKLPTEQADGPIRIAVVGRVSVRKGIDDVVALSHRLGDLAGDVQIVIYGGHSQWSDYRVLLETLSPLVAEYRGEMPWDFLTEWLPTCDIFVQPASYEPFGLTLGEALSSGLLVVATEKIGAAEGVAELVCRRYRAHSVDELESAVREGIREVQCLNGREKIRAAARHEAVRLYDSGLIAARVARALRETADRVASRDHPRAGRSAQGVSSLVGLVGFIGRSQR